MAKTLRTSGDYTIKAGDGFDSGSGTNTITLDSANVSVSGNLTVAGSSSTISTTNTTIEDNIIELNTGASANVNNAGIIIERGDAANVAIYWDESEDYFEFATTTDVGADATVASTGQVAIKVGNITSTGNIQLTGTLQFDSGQTVNEISDDTSLTDGAATALVTENAIKSHVSAQASAFAIALG